MTSVISSWPPPRRSAARCSAQISRELTYSDGAQGGRPPFDPLMMFKILAIRAAKRTR